MREKNEYENECNNTVHVSYTAYTYRYSLYQRVHVSYPHKSTVYMYIVNACRYSLLSSKFLAAKHHAHGKTPPPHRTG